VCLGVICSWATA